MQKQQFTECPRQRKPGDRKTKNPDKPNINK